MVVATVTDSSSAGETTGTPLTYTAIGDAPKGKHGRNQKYVISMDSSCYFYNFRTFQVGRLLEPVRIQDVLELV